MMNKWRSRREGRFSLRGARKSRRSRKSSPTEEEEKLEDPVELVRSASAPVAGAQGERIKDYKLRRQANTLFDDDEETKRPWRRDDGLNDDILDFIKTYRREKKNDETFCETPAVDEDDIDTAIEALQSFDAIGDRKPESLRDNVIESFFPIDEGDKVEVTLDEYKTRLQRLIKSIGEGSDSGSEESDSEDSDSEESDSDESDSEESDSEESDSGSEGSDSEYTYVTDSEDESSDSESDDESDEDSNSKKASIIQNKVAEIVVESDSDDESEAMIEAAPRLENTMKQNTSIPLARTVSIDSVDAPPSPMSSTCINDVEHLSPRESESKHNLELSYDFDDGFDYEMDDDDNELDSPVYGNIYDDDSVDSIEKLRRSMLDRGSGPQKMKSFRNIMSFSLKQTKTTMAEI